MGYDTSTARQALFNPWHRYNTKTGGAVGRLAALLALQSCGGGCPRPPGAVKRP
jgi:hypothetical protein